MRTTEASGEVDVLVVGAGPVGLLLASELVLGGASVQVLERATAPSKAIKAGSINLASAEILGRRGLLDGAREAHQRAVRQVAKLMEGALHLDPEQAFATASRKVVRAGHFAAIQLDNDKVDLADPDIATHCEALDGTLVVQREIEALLSAHADSLGVSVRRGIEVTGMEQTEDEVTVHTDAGDLHARFVVGCDGGRSVVRRSAGFEFPGTDPEITGRQAVADLEDVSQLRFGWNWSTRGVYRYGPTPGVVLTVEFDGPPADRTSEVTASEIEQSLRRTSGTNVRVTGLRGQATRWTDNARQAAAYRKARVLLAGDAAHVHSPFSGQGLNLGLGDATNLGWKLAATVAGWAPEGLLDTYSAERHPVGAWVLDWTRAQMALMRPDSKVGQLRSVVAELMSAPDGMTCIANKISGITQRIDLPGSHPLIGRLVPDITLANGRSLHTAFTGGQFVLLERSADSAYLAAAAPWHTRTVLLHDASTAGDPLAMLVRPDGVVVWAMDRDDPPDPDGLITTLCRWAGQPPSSAAPE